MQVSNRRATDIRRVEVMSVSEDAQQAPNETAEKDTSEWVTGDEPMTGPQRSYLNTLAQEAGREVPEDLTKAAASDMIDELQQETGRGASS
jgi:hypothetical protein